MTSLIQASEVINGGIVRPVPTNARFDSQLVAPHLAVAENRFLLPIICAAMYADMISKKNATPSNYNPNIGSIVQVFPADANYETLWTEFVMQLCAYGVLYMSLPFIGIQTGSNGLFINESQFAESAGIKGVKYLQDTILDNHIELIGQRLLEYLCDNAADYPLFPVDDKCQNCGCGCGQSNCNGLSTCPNKQRVTKKLGIIIY